MEEKDRCMEEKDSCIKAMAVAMVVDMAGMPGRVGRRHVHPQVIAQVKTASLGMLVVLVEAVVLGKAADTLSILALSARGSTQMQEIQMQEATRAATRCLVKMTWMDCWMDCQARSRMIPCRERCRIMKGISSRICKGVSKAISKGLVPSCRLLQTAQVVKAGLVARVGRIEKKMQGK